MVETLCQPRQQQALLQIRPVHRRSRPGMDEAPECDRQSAERHICYVI